MSGSHANPWRKVVGRFVMPVAVTVVLVTLAGAKAEAQTADAEAIATELQVFRHPSGVEIRVLELRAGVTNEEMIEALEAAARLLRTSPKITRTAHQEVLPDPDPETPPPVPPTPELPLPTAVTAPPAVSVPHAPPSVATLACQSAATELPSWLDQFQFTGLPATLLWQPPLANALQPRLALNLTSLRNDTTTKTIDTAIGKELGFLRVSPAAGCGLEVQQDFFAVVIARFSNDSDFTAADFRFGFPLTFAYENWHGKFGYEHTSTHLGDDFIKDTLRFKMANIRDEVVLGLDYRFAEQLRLYGVFGYSMYINTPTTSPPERYDLGVEWSRQQTTTWPGQPFAAFDVEFRGDQNYTADATLQLGWQWQDIDNGHSFRTGVELYNGRSPYGQFYLNREKWVGFGVWMDF